MQKEILHDNNEKFIVADTSALMSLCAGDMLEESLKISNIIIPEKVRTEIIEISVFDDQQGTYAKKVLQLINQNKIVSNQIKMIQRAEEIVVENSRIDIGEAEVIVLAEEKKIDIVITDDFEAYSQMCKVFVGKVYLSAYLVAGLVVTGVISKEEAQICLDKIAAKRTWLNAEIYIQAKKYIDEL
jgi:predicted nucleic acid-binding protein